MIRLAVAALLSVSLLACQGEQGPPGPMGPTGPTGPVEGAVSNRYCTKYLGNITYQYQIVRFASGDASAICSVATAWPVPAEYSATIYYRSGNTGTTTGKCWVYYDLDDANGGYFEFLGDAPGERVTYHDQNSTQDGTGYTFAAADCNG